MGGPLPALHKTDSAFKAGAVRTDDPEEERKQKAFKGILNKLTPDNFEKLSNNVGGCKGGGSVCVGVGGRGLQVV
jgi:translation initiation factor 4G